MAAVKALANAGARTVTSAVIVAVVLAMGGLERAYAQAPIVYAKAAPAYTSRVEYLPSTMASPVYSSGNSAIDLRASSAARAPVRPAAVSSVYAEPYAGPPYQVAGKWYVPTHEPNYDEVGVASWYGPTFHGKASSSGEIFDENAMTAAHPTLPIPSLVRVTNLENGRTIVVRLNDRGPFVDDRIIDLSKKAGEALDMHSKGTAKVRVQYVGPAPAAANAVPAQPAYQVAAPVAVGPAAPGMHQQKISVSYDLPALQSAPVAAAPVVHSFEQRGYFLQAGSFADLGNAHALRDQLKHLGEVSVSPVDVGGAEFYRVMVGPWASREQAERAQGRLVESGQKAFLVAKVGG